MRSLKKTKAFRSDTRDEERVARLEDTLSSRYLKKFYSEVHSGQSPDDFDWWQKQIGKLDTEYVQSDREYLQRMGQRLRYQIYALAVESFYNHYGIKSSARRLTAQVSCWPRDPGTIILSHAGLQN